MMLPDISGLQPNGLIPDTSANFNDDQMYTRVKRKTSLTFASTCSSNIPLSISNPALSYQTNNGNSYRCKLQKTSNTSTSQLSASTSSPIQPVINLQNNFNSNNVSQHYSLTNKSSSSSISSLSSLSTSSSPISPNINPIRTQSDFEANNQIKNQISSEADALSSVTNGHYNNNNHVLSHSSNQKSVSLNASPYLKTQSFSLLPDGNNKYLQEWIFTNRFSHILHLFVNYSSNDILRLSKEDLIKLCGAPDGIRLFNLAHNIQLKSKLTIFITFQSYQAYFSAIFMADWKCKSLIKRLFSLYSAFYRSLSSEDHENKSDKLTIKDEQIIDNNAPASSPSNAYSDDEEIENEENAENNSIIKNEEICNYNNSNIKKSNTNEIKSKENQDQLHIFEKMASNEYKYELFIKLKGILVKTTDEVLNNLVDQSRFLIQFELPAKETQQQETLNASENSSKVSILSKIKLDNDSLIKIIMIPLN